MGASHPIAVVVLANDGGITSHRPCHARLIVVCHRCRILPQKTRQPNPAKVSSACRKSTEGSNSQSTHRVSPFTIFIQLVHVGQALVLPAGPTVSNKPSRLNLNMALEISWAMLEESI